MIIRTALRLLPVAASVAVLLPAVAHADNTSSVPPIYQCYTLSTNPPAGPYKPEVTACTPR